MSLKTDLSEKYSVDELDKARFDASKMAAVTLENVISEGDQIEEVIDQQKRGSVEEERRATRILDKDTGRTKSRVLFVTSDESYLDEDSKKAHQMKTWATHFDEMHILALAPRVSESKPKRIAPNVWTYRAHAKYWWWLPVASVELAKEQLLFGEGFRPDIVVGLDPYESGLAAYMIGQEFDRPVQIHVTEDFTKPEFLKRERGNSWRKRMARYVLKRVLSVRTETTALMEQLQKKLHKDADIRVLPQFHNFSAFLEANATFDVHEKYNQYVFIILAFGDLTADSNLHDTFSALHTLLHNPKIGLIVIGDGPAKELFEKKAELINITKNVVFVPTTQDVASYLKTADVMVETSISKESEENVLKAAAAGLPMIMYKTDLRNDLFEDGVSASICEAGDVHAIEQNVNAFLNNQSLRLQYKEATQHIVKTRLVEDEDTFYRAWCDSVELALVEEDEEAETAIK